MLTTIFRGALAAAAMFAFSTAAEATPLGSTTWQMKNSGGDTGFSFYVGGNAVYKPATLNHPGAGATLTYDADAGSLRLLGSVFYIDQKRMVNFDLLYTDLTLDTTKNLLSAKDVSGVGTFDGGVVDGVLFSRYGNPATSMLVRYNDDLALRSVDGGLRRPGAKTYIGDVHMRADAPPPPPTEASEPAGLAVLGLGLAAAAVARRRRRNG